MRKEREFLNDCRRRAHRPHPDLRLGIGDDAAMIVPTPGLAWVVASDVMIEDVHFRRSYFPPSALGHKALAINLSDMAAMGAVPRWCLLTLAVPKSCDDPYIDAILGGLLKLADTHNVALVGGDTSHSPDRIVIDVTIIGEIVPELAVTRAGARSGDLIFVSGELGNAAAGLQLLERQADTGSLHHNVMPTLVAAKNALLQPAPRLRLGRQLAQNALATAMMDVSDGLSIDLSRLCEASGVGALIDEEAVPVAPGARVVSARSRQNPMELALHGGEDYELLFTAAPERRSEIEHLAGDLAALGDPVELTCIGRVTEAVEGIRIQTFHGLQPLAARGYDHFS